MAPESVVGQGLLGDDHLISTPDGRTLRAMVAGEGEDLVVLEAGLQSLRSAPIELGELPVHVLSGQRSGTLDAKARASLVQAHRRTASQHPQGRFVPAEDSGHMIPITEPALIAAEALSLLP
ncbi:MAG TPA: hypothetical protein VK095_03170 [Beutenbergiaceae bacterium]|nr:hypothetical protein [Beutenbergiaceae bacterium]